MSFDDRLRDDLRRATETHLLDTDAALHAVKSRGPDARVAGTGAGDALEAVALEDVEVPHPGHARTQRLVAVAAALVVLAAGIAIPFALRDRSHDSAHKGKVHTPKRLTTKSANRRMALNAVAAAVDATASAGSYRVSYTLNETPGSAPTTTACARAPLSLVGGPVAPLIGPTGTPPTLCDANLSVNNASTTGTATVNVDPFAMVAVSNVSGFGAVTVRVDDTNYWETTGSDMTPPADSVPGTPLSNFAGLVESTLGRREGAGAMMGLASPTGYLSITRAAITGAAETGTGTVNGERVTNYRVTVDPALLANVPGLSSEELTTINNALAVLRGEGFTGNTTDVSVNAAGYVVHTTSVNNFADGGVVTSDDTFSDFGCAGTVEIPGRHLGSVCHGTASVTTTTMNAATVIGSQGPPPGSVTAPTG